MNSLGTTDRSAATPQNVAHPISKSLRFEWPHSLGTNLALAVIVGILYSLWVIGPGPINPQNINWLTPDGATHQVAWELFRQDSHLHWPLTFTDRIGYPRGESMSLLDPDPLVALILKPFSKVLPEPFQYQGIEVVIICILQFFFALILFRVLLGSDPFAVVLPALFLLIAPPLTWRFAAAHYAMDNHWLILSSLVVFCMAQRKQPIPNLKLALYSALLIALSVAINPYLALQVLLIMGAMLTALVWRRRITLSGAAAILGLLALTGFVIASAFGLIIRGGNGYTAGGYRAYSLNLLALIDPQDVGAMVLPKLPRAFLEQYEGYSYLGLGAILLGIAALPLAIRNWKKWRFVWPQILLPLLGCCLLLTLLAVSTKVTLGQWTIVDLDPHERLSPYLASLRASGRLFWTPYYVLLAGILAILFRSLNRSWAAVLVTAALILQIADTTKLRHWTHSQVSQKFSSPLRSPVWSQLGKHYENLIVMPAWQCSMESSPGGRYGFRIFGFLAAAQRMRTNSYYAARYTQISKQVECGDAISDLSTKPLSPTSFYVVTPILAEQIERGPNGPGKCHSLDRFVVCSTENTFDLSTFTNVAEQLQHAIADPGFEDNDLSAWTSFQNVRASISSERAHGGRTSLSEGGGDGSVYQDVSGLEPGRTYAITAWFSGEPNATATGQIAVYDPGANLATFSAPAVPGQSWQLVTHSVTVKAAGSTLRIHLFRSQGSGKVFWDDVRIYRER